MGIKFKLKDPNAPQQNGFFERALLPTMED